MYNTFKSCNAYEQSIRTVLYMSCTNVMYIGRTRGGFERRFRSLPLPLPLRAVLRCRCWFLFLPAYTLPYNTQQH